ncbi:MAG: glycosyltransferase family 4 protein [Oligoflexia bacterium]|nr:glycosyltransferase family 4 protein [Oligoflexia bacterium]
MKIGLLTSRSDIGGGPKHTYELAQFLKENGHEIIVWSPLDEPYGKKLKKAAHQFFPISQRSFNIFTFFKMLIFIKNENLKLVHSHGRGAGIYTKLLFLFGVKVVHTFHGVHHPKNKKERIKNIFDSIFRHNISLGIFVSESEKETAKEVSLLPQKFQIIPNGVTIPQTSVQRNSNGITLGTLSRLDIHKGNHLLIKNFLELSKKYPSAQLKIAGSGEEKENLEKIIKENNAQDKVHLVGEVEEPYEFLESLDYYVSNSLGEGLPYAVLEAFSMKRPCLLSHVPGHRSLLPNDELFQVSNAESFINSFEKINEIKEYHINRNFEAIVQNYSKEKNFSKLIERYSKI